MGKLIVIEGVDGSGKETQSKQLVKRLTEEGYKTMLISYPRYERESSLFVKNYLGGQYGDNAKEINPYTASTFYALDRYDSYKKEIEPFYKEDGIIIADRYTTANMVHQAGKIEDKAERDKFLNWLWNHEFGVLGLPVPDLVFFLDIPVEYNKELIEKRASQGVESGKDIHEKDINHLTDSYNNACELVDKYDWSRINCIKDGNLRKIEDIHNEIYSKVVILLGKEKKCSLSEQRSVRELF